MSKVTECPVHVYNLSSITSSASICLYLQTTFSNVGKILSIIIRPWDCFREEIVQQLSFLNHVRLNTQCRSELSKKIAL